jgi:hypothetical protein
MTSVGQHSCYAWSRTSSLEETRKREPDWWGHAIACGRANRVCHSEITHHHPDGVAAPQTR